MHSNKVDFDEVERLRLAIAVAIHGTGNCQPLEQLIALHGLMGAIVMRMPREVQTDVAAYWANTWEHFVPDMYASEPGVTKH